MKVVSSLQHSPFALLSLLLCWSVACHVGACVKGDGSPQKAFARKVDMARPGDHPDVLRYRYSNGLCPDVYQVGNRPKPSSVIM